MQKTPATGTPQAAPQAAPIAAPLTVEALQAREFVLQAKVNELVAQRAILTQQMATGSPALRVTSEVQRLQIDLDLASNKAELDAVRAELAVRKGQPQAPPQTFIAVPPPLPRTFIDRIDPDALTAAFIVTVLAVLMPLSIGISRRLWRRGGTPSKSVEDKIAPRLDHLEHAVDAIAIEVERISESQRFMAKVLAERPVSAAPAPADSASAAPLAEGTPFLALGAGPMEPIHAPERQAVRASVTPH
jgi:hypothetical protein